MDNNVKSYRKPYVRPVKANWWTDRAFYIAYMLREGTAVVSLFVALELMAILLLPIFEIDPKSLICNPIVILFNIVALVAVLYHAFTWYNLMPKAVRVFTSGEPTNTKLLPGKLVVSALWIGTAVASVVIALALILA